MTSSLLPLAAEGGELNLMLIVGIIVALGVGSQVISDRYRVPSVPFLILAGIRIGPRGLGIVTRQSFGNALWTIVGLSAIIVFETPLRAFCPSVCCRT